MSKILIVLLCFFCLSVKAQDKDEAVDEHALHDTKLLGSIGLPQSSMSVACSEAALLTLLKKNIQQEYYVFPEHRENPIRLLNTLPEIWLKRSEQEQRLYCGKVQPGEFFTFQIGVFAPRKSIEQLSYKAINLPEITCFNLEGVDHLGYSFNKQLTVRDGSVQPLWFGIPIPSGARGEINGKIVLQSRNAADITIDIKLKVIGQPIENWGCDEDWRLARLSWLNSTIELNDSITKGYVPLVMQGNKVKLLGRELTIAQSGLPATIGSYFNSSNSAFNKDIEPILADECRFIVEQTDSSCLRLVPGKLKVIRTSPSSITWQVTNRSKQVDINIIGTIDFSGCLTYNINLLVKQNISIRDIRLEIPMTKEKSHYLMGMGKEGGLRPESWQWKWDVSQMSQDVVWVGGVNGGISLKLKSDNYRRQLVNIYYPYGTLQLPPSWGNGDRGGCHIYSTLMGTLIKAYSGKRFLEKGMNLAFDMDLLITPFKLINKEIQFGDRYYHNSSTDISERFIDEAEQIGANIINIHHKKDINPFINYPYFSENVADLSSFVDKAHARKKRVKLYYTTRELTVNAPEIWAMRSLGDELLYPGPGIECKTVINPSGPHVWLTENFKEKFIPAWKCTFNAGKYKGRQDLSVITQPDSRLNNYYLEGLDWLCKKVNIDGVYLDGTALDRNALKRARKILDKNRPNARIDMHIWNNFKKYGCYASGLNLYMDMLPYIDHLWIGEGRSYDTPADYWLVEMSGIPFGVPSQMLNQGGNRWRGMIFGMTNRAGWYGPTPHHIWHFWTEQRIQTMNMIGFWDKDTPVKTDNVNLLTTVYIAKDKAVVSVANWSGEEQSGKLLIDWNKMGMSPKCAQLSVPTINQFQEAQQIKLSDSIVVPGGKGFLIVLEYPQVKR